MGRYIDWSAVVNRYPDAAKISGASEVGSAWLLASEHEIDARLGGMYTVPFTPVPPLVQDIVTDMTYWRMTLREESSKSIKEYIDERIKGLVDGSITLTTSGGAVIEASASAMPYYSSEGDHTSFGPDSEVNWTVSSNWIENVQDERGYP